MYIYIYNIHFSNILTPIIFICIYIDKDIYARKYIHVYICSMSFIQVSYH